MVSALSIARQLVAQAVPVLRCHPGLKRPWANDEGAWDTCDDPDLVASWLKPGDNLGLVLGGAKGSPVVGLGLDCYKNQDVMDFAKQLGVTFKGSTWSQRTGRGGYTIFYYYNGLTLKRDTSGCDGALDLLVSGYSLIAPSDTSKEPQGGGPYQWLPEHSPLDIPLAELDTPPKALLTWWQSLSAPKLPETRNPIERRNTPDWLTGPIPEGQRNQILTRRAGYYHRMLPDEEVVRGLVHAANRIDCLPPLSEREVEAIVASILKRPGGNHYRGVSPARLETVR